MWNERSGSALEQHGAVVRGETIQVVAGAILEKWQYLFYADRKFKTKIPETRIQKTLNSPTPS